MLIYFLIFTTFFFLLQSVGAQSWCLPTAGVGALGSQNGGWNQEGFAQTVPLARNVPAEGRPWVRQIEKYSLKISKGRPWVRQIKKYSLKMSKGRPWVRQIEKYSLKISKGRPWVRQIKKHSLKISKGRPWVRQRAWWP